MDRRSPATIQVSRRVGDLGFVFTRLPLAVGRSRSHLALQETGGPETSAGTLPVQSISPGACCQVEPLPLNFDTHELMI